MNSNILKTTFVSLFVQNYWAIGILKVRNLCVWWWNSLPLMSFCTLNLNKRL